MGLSMVKTKQTIATPREVPEPKDFSALRTHTDPANDEVLAKILDVFAKFLDGAGAENFFKLIDFVAAIDSIKFSSKSEPFLRFFGRLKIASASALGHTRAPADA